MEICFRPLCAYELKQPVPDEATLQVWEQMHGTSCSPFPGGVISNIDLRGHSVNLQFHVMPCGMKPDRVYQVRMVKRPCGPGANCMFSPRVVTPNVHALM